MGERIAFYFRYWVLNKSNSPFLIAVVAPFAMFMISEFTNYTGICQHLFPGPYLIWIALLYLISGQRSAMVSGMLGTVFIFIFNQNIENFKISTLVIDSAIWIFTSFALIFILKKLKVKSDFFDSMMENLPLGVYIKDAQELRFRQISNHGEAFFGSRGSFLVGKSAKDLFSQEQSELFDKHDREILESGGVHKMLQEFVQTKSHGERCVKTKKWKMSASDGSAYLFVVSEDITERTQTEQKVRSSEMKYRSLVQSAMDAVIGADQNGKITSWNKSAEKLFGYREAEIIGRPLQIILPDRLRKLNRTDLDEIAAESGAGLSGKVLNLIGMNNANEEFAIEITVSHWTNESSELCYTTVIRDVSARKKANDELDRRVVERTRDFSLLSESIPQLIWSMDADGKGLYFNRQWIEYTGISLNKPGRWEDIIHPDDIETSRATWNASLVSGFPFSVEYRLKGPDDRYRWHLSRAVAVKNEDGSILKWFGTSTNIDAQYEAQETLLELKQRTDSVIQNAPVLLWAVDKEGVFTYYDGKVKKALGIETEDRIGVNILSLYRDRPEIAGSVERALRGETISDVSKIGEVYLENKFSPQFDSSGEVNGVVGLSVDITERRRAERESAEAEVKTQLAVESSRMKSEFLATMSHEIRTPLNGVIGMINLLLDTKLTPEQQNFGGILLNSADTLLALINDILDLSKADAGKILLESVSFQPSLLIDKVEQSLRLSTQQKGLKMSMVVAKNIPKFVQGDPNRLQQILLNLLNNAIKFTNSGELKVSVARSGQDEKKLRFEISDTGIGIGHEAIAKMFQPFSQADASTTRRFGGTGLGLSIAKHLVTLMNGEIGVESHLNVGSTFWFEIPLEKGTSLNTTAVSILSESKECRELKILLAEDIPVNQFLAVKMLEKMGHRVVVAANGREALSALQRENFDVVLMDCNMPELDGYETTRKIRSGECLQPLILIIAMTANAMAGDRDKCLLAGMTDYISKPIKYLALEEIIQKNFKLRIAA